MNMGKFIRINREKCNLSQNDLAKMIGVSKSAISRYENGNIGTVGLDKIELLAKAINVDPMIFVTGDENYTRENDNGITPLYKAKKIPILGTIACGNPIFAEENIDGYFIADNNIKADFSVKAKGDSMIDIGIHDGDLIFLRQQPVLENGEIGAVLIDNEATLKKVYINDSEMILQPCNRNYPPIVVKGGNVKIMGKLVGYYHNMEK